jgi:hypothetical protein
MGPGRGNRTEGDHPLCRSAALMVKLHGDPERIDQ